MSTHRHTLLSLAVTLSMMWISLPVASAQTAPANDDFANAELLATDGTWLGTNVGATTEAGEPPHAGVLSGASVWFQWTAPVDGFLTVDTFGSNFDTILALYTGESVDALTEVASNDDAVGLLSQLWNVEISAGLVYHIAVAGYNSPTGQITLSWALNDGTDTTPPQVFIISPEDGSTFIQNDEVQAFYYCEDEPFGSDIATCIGDIPSDDLIDTSVTGSFTFSVTGTDNAGNATTETSNYTVVEPPPPPANDDFANAEVLATDGTWPGTNFGATFESGEPLHAGSLGASVWFQWTAPTDGYLTVDTFGSDFDTVLAMYSGEAVDALTSLAEDDDTGSVQSQLPDVPVTSGTIYHIAVDGYLGSTGQIALNWSFWDGTDTTAPTVAVITPAEGATFVENAVVAADYSCIDEALGSGVATCTGDVATGEQIDTFGAGPKTFSVTATDVAGNVAVATVNYTVGGIDVTPPTVTIESPLDGTIISMGGTLTAGYTCTDEVFGTGIAACVGDVPEGDPIDTSATGSFTFTVTGTDNAGNVASAVSTYTVIDALANDNFANAEILAQDGTWLGTNVGATKESGEPNHAGNSGGASVWFQWTAAFDGYLTVDTFGSDFDTTLGLYTGNSVDALTVVASNDDSSGAQSKIADVTVTTGTVYHIAVDGYFGTTGTITLNWSLVEQFDTVPPTVTIWDPVDGITVPQGHVETCYYTCFDASPTSGIASCAGDVPSGDPIDTSTPGTFVFTATGTDNAGNVGVATATYTVVGNPPNDDFADATVLATEGTISGTNAGATKEPGEPNIAGNVGGTSVWFQWTAPVDGFVTVDTFGSDFDTVLGMYTGTAVDALTEVASDQDAPGGQSEIMDVPVTAGTIYSIGLSGFVYASGQYTLNWSFLELNDLTPPTVTMVNPADGTIFFEGVTSFVDYSCADEDLGSGLSSCIGDLEVGAAIDTTVAGAYTFTVTGTDNAGNFTVETSAYVVEALTNDDFVNALVITGDGGLIGSNVGTTKEAGEPDHAGDPGGASVWFQWTAPSDGFLTVDTFGSDFDTTLAVYTGTMLDALTELGSSDNADGPQSEVRDILVIAGETYYIAVDGLGGASGQIDLDWSVFDGPIFTEITPAFDPLWVTDADHDFWLNAAAPADVDGDGDLDLAVIGYFVEYNVSAEDRLIVFLNDGPGPDGNWLFTTRDVPLNGLFAGESDLAWGDFDGDGDPDLAVASENATELYRNDAGTLVPINTELPGYNEDSNYTGAYDLRSITWADYDNDSDLDLLIPSTFDSENFVFGTALMRNDGDDGLGGWAFTEVDSQLDGTIHAQTAWADDDGDGDLDLFMANIDNYLGNGSVRTYRNDGGVFTSADPVGSLTIEYGLGDWSDYDGDGDLDILVVGLVLDTDDLYKTILRVYDNEAGTYVPNTLVQSSFFPWLDLHAATWADYDSDGDVDILLTGAIIGPEDIEGKSEIYVNDGGVFTPLGRDLSAPFGSIGNGGSFTWFDVDNDGDLDYFVAGAYYLDSHSGLVEARMNLYRNDALVPNAAPDAPGGLSSDVGGSRSAILGETASLSWDPATDDATAGAAITYDLDVRLQAEVINALGTHRRLPEPGNVSAATNWTLQGLPPGTYTWMVRAVDSAFNGSVAAESSFTIGPIQDADGDGIADSSDNCLAHPNPDQRDSNGDGYGNRCDPDLNGDGIVNFIDLGLLRSVFFTPNADADLNGDGTVNFIDLGITRVFFLQPPGPSGLVR